MLVATPSRSPGGLGYPSELYLRVGFLVTNLGRPLVPGMAMPVLLV
jgi:hypothetical protein